jgi:hypothetical protein
MEPLSLPQQLELERMRRAGEQMSKAQALDLLIQAKRLLFIKENVLKSLTDRHGQQQPPR